MPLSPTIATLIRNAWGDFYLCLLVIAACVLLTSAASALDLNSFRAQNGMPRLSASGALMAKARAHATDMARRQSMDHNGFTERMRGSRAAAENVAAGCPTADCVFKIWAESSGH